MRKTECLNVSVNIDPLIDTTFKKPYHQILTND